MRAVDRERSRRWTKALVEFADQRPGNREAMAGWLETWVPLAERAAEAYCAGLPGADAAAATAAARAFRAELGFST